MNPFLYGVVCLILEITQLSAAPNPARSPVSGWIQPIVMPLVLPELAPLMPELHAWSSPPAPTHGRAGADRAQQAPSADAVGRAGAAGLHSLVTHLSSISL